MFKSIHNSNLDKLKNGTILPGRQALDFALAEFSSAIEMLQAAAQEGLADAIQIDGIRTENQLKILRPKFDSSIQIVANHVDGGKLSVRNYHALEDCGVNILTLSTFMLSTYINQFNILEEQMQCNDLIPNGPLKLNQIESFLEH